MQLDGVQIDPKEWWDPHWIQDHITKRLDAGMEPMSQEAAAPYKKQSHSAKSKKHR
jgi:hypothetical protein